MTAIDVYAQPRFAPLPGKAKMPRWREITAELAQHPGEWAAVATQIGFRTPLTRRQLDRYGVECAVRTNGDGTCTVWMRHLGADEQAPTYALTRSFYDDARANARAAHPAGRNVRTYKWFMGRRVVTA